MMPTRAPSVTAPKRRKWWPPKQALRRLLFGPTFEELTPFQRCLCVHLAQASRPGALRQ